MGRTERDLFPGFEARWIETPTGRWFARVGGDAAASPLLLLHGFPQTHAMWHPIAPDLARDHRVICLDLKGYGWSDAPEGGAGHEAYAKRTLGTEIVALMERIGHIRFTVIGHDRGARVGYRMALDRPERIERLALIDIVPTAVQWERIEAEPELYPHWPFLAAPAPEPETQIGRDPDGYYEGLLREWSKRDDLAIFDPRALKAYRQSWNVPERIHAMCEDYRAGGADGPDRAADLADLETGRTLPMPVLTLAGRSFLDSGPEPALSVWQRTFAPKATGECLPGGHFIVEECSDAVLAALRAFLAA